MIGIDLIDPVARNETRSQVPTDPDAVVAELDERQTKLSALYEKVRDNLIPGPPPC